MQGRKDYTEKLFTSFQLSNRVPKENIYRRLWETLDLSFLYKDTKECELYNYFAGFLRWYFAKRKI